MSSTFTQITFKKFLNLDIWLSALIEIKFYYKMFLQSLSHKFNSIFGQWDVADEIKLFVFDGSTEI